MEIVLHLLVGIAGLFLGVLLGYRYKCGGVGNLAASIREAREEIISRSKLHTETCDLYQQAIMSELESEAGKFQEKLCHPATMNLLDKLYIFAESHLGRPVTMEEAELIEALIQHGHAGSPNTTPQINSSGSFYDN